MASIEARTAKLYFIANGRFSHSGSHIYTYTLLVCVCVHYHFMSIVNPTSVTHVQESWMTYELDLINYQNKCRLIRTSIVKYY